MGGPPEPCTSDIELFAEAARHVRLARLSDKAFAPDGFGRVLDEIRSKAYIAIEALQKGPSAIRDMPRVILDYIDTRVLAAYAFAHKGRHFIGLSGFGVSAIYFSMLRLLSHPGVLDEIGCCSSESVDMPDIPASLDIHEIASGLIQADTSMRTFIPKDKTRELTALAMTRMAVDFIILHEFRHLQAGHVGFIEKLTLKPLIQELSSTGNGPPLSMILQALEMDADSYAITNLLRVVIHFAEADGNVREGWASVFPDAKRAAFLSLLAPCIVFKLFERFGKTSDRWDQLSHPPPAMRMQMAVATAMEFFQRWRRSDLCDWLKARAGRLGAVVETEVSLVTGAPSSPERLRRISGPEGCSHASRILETWRDIEAQLSEYSYVSFAGLRAD